MKIYKMLEGGSPKKNEELQNVVGQHYFKAFDINGTASLVSGIKICL
jgi:hypothetical protein